MKNIIRAGSHRVARAPTSRFTRFLDYGISSTFSCCQFTRTSAGGQLRPTGAAVFAGFFSFSLTHRGRSILSGFVQTPAAIPFVRGANSFKTPCAGNWSARTVTSGRAALNNNSPLSVSSPKLAGMITWIDMIKNKLVTCFAWVWVTFKYTVEI